MLLYSHRYWEKNFVKEFKRKIISLLCMQTWIFSLNDIFLSFVRKKSKKEVLDPFYILTCDACYQVQYYIKTNDIKREEKNTKRMFILCSCSYHHRSVSQYLFVCHSFRFYFKPLTFNLLFIIRVILLLFIASCFIDVYSASERTNEGIIKK